MIERIKDWFAGKPITTKVIISAIAVVIAYSIFQEFGGG